ncbi:OB-fold nucleic acid binding domain-containing protein, partial [Ornithinicoccus halotolerans]|uniref:OB-fold nucleic acid binding domain-containing protein n=1 Tax=Ornithinicoccus halotolerans TaxID=1748220 RepID=UPI002B21B836
TASGSRGSEPAPALPGADPPDGPPPANHEVAARTQAQARGARSWHQRQVDPTQLALDLGDAPAVVTGSGLPEMTPQERVRAELEVLGLDVSSHVTTTYRPLLQALGVVPAAGLVGARNRTEVLVAGAKVATQTPPVRSGRRVVFLTLDDGTGPSDAAFFEEAQATFAGTVFDSWLLLVRGVVRRTGPRGVSLTADATWELSQLQQVFETAGLEAVRSVMAEQEQHARAVAADVERAARAARAQQGEPAGRRVLVHASGFRQSPYADIAPVEPTTKLWHSSPGSAGW